MAQRSEDKIKEAAEYVFRQSPFPEGTRKTSFKRYCLDVNTLIPLGETCSNKECVNCRGTDEIFKKAIEEQIIKL
jgi:hypothetical protein